MAGSECMHLVSAGALQAARHISNPWRPYSSGLYSRKPDARVEIVASWTDYLSRTIS
jgi:hypothetical protein